MKRGLIHKKTVYLIIFIFAVEVSFAYATIVHASGDGDQMLYEREDLSEVESQPNDVSDFQRTDDNENVVKTQEELVEDFVERFYNYILDRDSEPAGLENWKIALIAGTRGGADVAFEFIKSPEFQLKTETDVEYITRLYHAFFDREPDPKGMQSWLNDLENGKDRDFILNGFLASQEYKALCEEYGIKRDSTRTFVRRFYKLIMGRTDDQITPDELDNWQIALDAKALTGAEMARDWINTRPEFLARTLTDEEYVQILYNVVFDRDADPSGLATWTGELKNGKIRSEVLDQILASNEFKETCAAYGIEVGNLNVNYEFYTFSLSTDDIFKGKYSDEEMGDYCIDFYANIVEFTGVMLGKKHENGSSLMIDNDYIYVIKDNNTVLQSELKIEITDNLKILIETDMKNKAVISISSNGNSQAFYEVPWEARQGKLYVKTDEYTSFNNCYLKYTCNGWKKPIWMFGDSYFNCSAPERWTSYLTLGDCDNYLLNGYPGRKSDAALESLIIMLNYDTPDEIIWCMGMNDGDSEYEINALWKKDVEEVIRICSENDIQLILSTIPDCPTVNNSCKNRFVKDSGYKYIDFAKAVGAYENLEWTEGMLEEGEARIHPTNKGAKALYTEAVSVCPELLQ